MNVPLELISVIPGFLNFHGEDRPNFFMATTSAVVGELPPPLPEGYPRESAVFIFPLPGYTDHSYSCSSCSCADVCVGVVGF